jgi:hypothetical protein
MRLLVEDFLKMGALAELDTETGELGAAPGGATRAEVRGAFMKLGPEMACFYVDGGELCLRVGAEVARLAESKVAILGDGLRRLTVEREGREILTHQYPNPVNPPVDLDGSLAEEEDFDLGLFATNVHNADKRRRFQLRKWGA